MVEPRTLPTIGCMVDRRANDVKVWPLDDHGNQRSERPGYHWFRRDGWEWTILRPSDGVWFAHCSEAIDDG